MTLIAAFELCRFTRLLTRFTHDIFAFFVCSIYVQDGVRGVFDRFGSTLDPADAGNALLCFVMATGIVLLSLLMMATPSSIFFVRRARSLISQYALAISIAIIALFANTFFQPTFTVDFVKLPGMSPTDASRSWWVGLSGDWKEWFVAIGAALMIVIFFFIDQNISSALCQKREMLLQKGSYFHSSFLLMGAFNMIGPLFGLPFVTGSLPHSPQMVIAATSLPNAHDYDDKTEAQKRWAEQRTVLETRFAPLLCYSLIGFSLLVPGFIRCLPEAAVDGTLIFVGLEGLVRTQLWERLMLIFSEPRMYPRNRYTEGTRITKMHMYTLIQLACWGMCWLIDRAFGIIFPVWVALLVPIRIFVLPKIFSREELLALDSESAQLVEGQRGGFDGI